jgi:V-type H+-transporting ATPase subunit G
VKIARLKQAKEEAEREVALYRSHLEAEFQKKISEVSIPVHCCLIVI